MTNKTKILSFVACLATSATISFANEATAGTSGVAAIMADKSALEAQKNWETKISLGYELNNGNTESESFSGAISTEKNFGVWRFDAKLEGSYKEDSIEDTNGNKIKEQTDGQAKFKAELKRLFDVLFIYAGEELFHDAIGGVKYRSITSAGVGIFLWDTPEFNFPISAGFAYVKEEAPISEDYVALHLTEESTWNVNDTLKVWQKFEVIPQVDDFDNVLINGEIGGEAKLTETLSITMKYVIEYDAEPGFDNGKELEKTDSKFITQISYSF
jgi:putative salt-induced outer membrane protein YdiY